MKKSLARIIWIASAKEALFYKIIFCLTAVFVFSLLFNWSRASMHPEYAQVNGPASVSSGFINNSLKNGLRLTAVDFLRGFDVLSFETGAPRVRFVSNLLLLLNVKLRVWLWNYIPPHPSLSLTWLFSLILSPIFFYRLIYNLTHDRRACWIGLSLYFISTGFLSGVLWLFHPGKPMTNFFAILGFYFCSQAVSHASIEQRLSQKIFRASALFISRLSAQVALGKSGFQQSRLACEGASRIEEYKLRKEKYSRKTWGAFLSLIGVLGLGFFTDETAWFLFLIVPVLFPGMFLLKSKGARFAFIYVALGCAFISFLTFGAPALLKSYGFDSFNFWKWVTSPDTSPEAGSFRFVNVAVQGYIFLTDHVSAFQRQGPHRGLAITAFLLYSSILIVKLPSKSKRLCLRILLSTIVFLFCQSLMLSKHRVVVPSTWYYGAMFPIFFSLLWAVLLSVPQGALRLLNMIVFVLLLLISFSHSRGLPSSNPGITYLSTIQAWKVRGNEAALARVQSYYFAKTSWPLLELKHADNPVVDRQGIAGLIEKFAYGLENITSGENLLHFPGVVISTESFNLPHEGVHALADDDSFTFWHVALGKLGRPTWVEVDFGERNAAKVKCLTAQPRHDRPEQFFHNAELLGSNNGKEWEKVADIRQATKPEDNEIQTWKFDNHRSFRYYRLSILNGYFGGTGNSFASMAELGLYK